MDRSQSTSANCKTVLFLFRLSSCAPLSFYIQLCQYGATKHAVLCVCVCVCVCVCMRLCIFLSMQTKLYPCPLQMKKPLKQLRKPPPPPTIQQQKKKEYKTLGWRIFYGTGISVWPFSSLVQNQNFNEQFPRRWWKIWDILNAILGHECH